MTRAEHLAWCKERAHAEVDRGSWQNGVLSMLSDLGKHPETKSSVSIGSALMLTVRDEASARKYIDGFN